MDKAYNVLFICTCKSVRSVIAVGLMNELGHGRFKSFFITTKRCMQLMLSLPLARLDRMAIQTEIKDIGNR